VRQVGYLQRLYRDARLTEHKISISIWNKEELPQVARCHTLVHGNFDKNTNFKYILYEMLHTPSEKKAYLPNFGAVLIKKYKHNSDLCWHFRFMFEMPQYLFHPLDKLHRPKIGIFFRAQSRKILLDYTENRSGFLPASHT